MTTFLRNPDCLTELRGAFFASAAQHRGRGPTWGKGMMSTTGGRPHPLRQQREEGGWGATLFCLNDAVNGSWRASLSLTGMGISVFKTVLLHLRSETFCQTKKEEPSFCSFWNPTQQKNVSWRCTKNKKNETESNFVAHRFENDRFLLLMTSWVHSEPTKKCYRQLFHSKVVGGLKMTEKHWKEIGAA